MIITPPTNLRRYIETRRAQISKIAEQSVSVREQVLTLSTSENQRLLASWLRYTDDDAAHWAHSSDHFAGYRFDRLDLAWLSSSLDAALQHGSTFLHYIPTAAESGRPLDPSEAAFFAILEHTRNCAVQYGFVPGTPDTGTDPDYVGALALADALSSLHNLMNEAFAVKADIKTRIEAVVDLRNMLDPHKWRPAHQSVETLWHASIYAGEIGRSGFLREKPAHRKGMGNFGSQATISLTAEREIATSIADCLTDAWDIAHGLVTPQAILALIRSENLDISLQSHFGHIDPETLTSSLDAMKLFHIYLAHTQSRDNPSFVNPDELLEALTSANREDIGIVECQTRIDEQAEFLVGEAEFRVSVDHVIGARFDTGYKRSAMPLVKPQDVGQLDNVDALPKASSNSI
jgi:hypothetical protein